MKLTRIYKGLIGGLVLLGLAGSANALTVRVDDDGVASWNGSSCSQSCIETRFGADDISLLYRATFGDNDSGSYANGYSTQWSNSSSDPEDARIREGSGSNINCGYCYLVVKRESNAGYYFFDLSFGWNGTSDLIWDGNRDIRQISIWGGGKKVNTVPEPSTLGLFGLGLLAVGLARRWKR